MNIYRLEVSPTGEMTRAPESFIASRRLDLHPSFSPDGETIAFVSDRSGDRQIWVCDRGGERLRELTQMNSTWGMYPYWSPDSQSIAFDADQDGNLDVYALRLEGGGTRRLTTDPANDENPSWSPDGKWILFESDRSGKREVWKISPEGGEPIRADLDFLGVFSLYDNMTYFTTKNPTAISLWQQPNDSEEAREILTDLASRSFALTAKGVFYIAGSPDFAAQEERQLCFYSWHQQEVSTIAPITKDPRADLSVSPDGQTILFSQADREGGDIVLVENFR